ncbi:Myb-like_DNA-binding domain-containing protein [Hexamita inflata]|uniref:Myb-like DNA-binding domain-containing protein n=1 Tax=Hexamita inflata TaxID=28002 RepID=A0AA86V0F7_9EUKA|nr:Myb-like DNA-binding domain-containing protein [Hexamita inflata]
MNSNPDKTKYILWSDSEIKKLNQVVQKVTQGKTYTNWHKVAEEMAPRTLQQCKSYYGQLTNQSGTLKQKFSQVVQKPEKEFNAQVVFKSLPVEKQMKCYTLPNYYNFDWERVKQEFKQFSVSQLQELYLQVQENLKQQKQVIGLIVQNQFQLFSTQQLKHCYCNFQYLQYGLILEQLSLKNTDISQIPPKPITFDGFNNDILIEYPPQPHLIQFYHEIVKDCSNIDQVLFNLVIELSHRTE